MELLQQMLNIFRVTDLERNVQSVKHDDHAISSTLTSFSRSEDCLINVICKISF